MPPLHRKLKAPINRKRMPRATVLLGWSMQGRPVASIPLVTAVAVERRILIWRKKGYKVSAVVEFDFI